MLLSRCSVPKGKDGFGKVSTRGTTSSIRLVPLANIAGFPKFGQREAKDSARREPSRVYSASAEAQSV